MRALCLFALLCAACSSTTRPPVDAGPDDNSDPSPIDLSDWQAADLQPDAGTVQFIAELTKAHLGEAADLDGDGVRELSSLILADGTQIWVWADGARESFRIERFPDGRRRYTYYYSNNGAPPVIDNYGLTSRVTVFDDNFDRKFDRQRTQTPSDAGLVEIVDAVDGGAAGWVEVGRYVASTTLDQQVRRDALCDGNSNFPNMPSPTNAPSIGFSATPGVTCSESQRNKLAQAFECTKDKLLGCMGRMNQTLQRQVIAHLVSDSVQIGCGNPCSGTLASTSAVDGATAGRMNFNSSRLDSWTPEFTCAVMLHEFIHVAEVGFDSDHDKGLDQTYACSNYCGGCQLVGPYGPAAPFTPPPSQNENCARCGETPTERKTCGERDKLKDGACVTNYTLCHGGLGDNALCETCGNLEVKDCVGGELAPPRFNCCYCPAAETKNDKPCPGPLMESDTCSMMPPECKK